MKRRHHRRRTGNTVLAGAAVLIGMLATTATSPAEGASTTGTVHTAGTQLNVRLGTTITAAKTSMLAQGSRVTIVCQAQGQHIRGNVRSTNLWDQLPNGSYVSDAYIRRGSAKLPRCSEATLAAATKPANSSTWVMPVPAVVGSAFRSSSRPTHDGIDLSAARNTPIRATAAGKVTVMQCNASTGNCDVDGNVGVQGCGWYVEIQHPGPVITRYCHMIKRPTVRVGQVVPAGHVLGFVGSSGNSSGPHLHFEIHVNGTYADSSNAVDPVTFLRAKGIKLV